MFIDNNKKFIFISVPKTGSKSINCALGHTKHPEPKIYHATAQEIIDEHPETINYLKFAFIRNPFSRLVSLYYDFTLKRGNLYSEFDQRNKPLLNEFKDFNDFCIKLKDSEWRNDRFFWPQINYLTYNNKYIDYIGRYEILEEDFRYITDQLGIQNIYLTHQNKGIYKEKDYRQHYSPEARNAIQDLYFKDLTVFGYEF